MSRVWTRACGLAAVAAAALWMAPAAFAQDFTGDAAKGKEIYEGMGTCWTCHGKSGTGDGPAGAALNPAPRDFTTGEFKFDANKNGTPGEPEDLFLVIKNGAAPYGGNPSMTPWGHLGDDAIKDLVAYVLSMSKS